jgi:hypothetical protein
MLNKPPTMADSVSVKSYLLSLPERLARSAIGLGAGMVREVGEVAIPRGIRRSHLYQNLVDATLRFLIEDVGAVDGVYNPETKLTGDFFVRKLVGDALEGIGIAAFRVSPVWVLAALSDACGAGKHLIPEIGAALAAEGLLDKNVRFTSVKQILDALERTSSRLATSISAPPLDVATLRREWEAIRQEVRSIPPDALPSREALRKVWTQLETEAARQNRSVFEVSTILAVAAAEKFPDHIRWMSTSARVAAHRTSIVFGQALLNDYRQTLTDLRRVGFGRYAIRQCWPYVHAAVSQFSPFRRTLTERLIAGRVGLMGRVGQLAHLGQVGQGPGARGTGKNTNSPDRGDLPDLPDPRDLPDLRDPRDLRERVR